MTNDVKRVLVTFTSEQWKLIKPFIGTVGRGDAGTVRGIVVTWLLERGYGGDMPRARDITKAGDQGK